MTLLKLVFVLLILIPVALAMIYIVNNLLDEAKKAKNGTIDLDIAREAKRKNKKKRKTGIKPRAKKEKPAADAGERRKPAKKTARKSSSKPARKPASKPARQQSARPQARRQSAPSLEPVQDKSQSYIEEYNRRRSELESNSRRAGKRNTMEEFDLLYGGSSSGKKTTRKSTGKKTTRKSGKSTRKGKK